MSAFSQQVMTTTAGYAAAGLQSLYINPSSPQIGTYIMPKSTFEQAFKIAQIMVDRPAVDPTDLKGFLALVAEIQKALDE